MKKLFLTISVFALAACNEKASCPETVVIDTPYGKLEVVKGPTTDSYLETATAASKAEKNLDKPMVDTPSRGY